MRLLGRVALITGGSAGIGECIARTFAREGSRVAIAARSRAGAEAVAAGICDAGGEAIAVQADVSVLADHDRLVHAVVDRFGKLDILVNNAGVFINGALEDVSERDWDTIVATNLKGLFFLTQRAVVEMRRQGKGKVINIGSQAGETSFPKSAVYGASKAGVNGLTRALGVELAPFRINVNGISPSNVETPINSHLMREPAYYASLLQRTPYGRTSRPEDVAPAAVYLASDESDYVCGVTIAIDGGWLAQ
ncbi:MAG: SDR family oxidoreductase [Chloroflexi bacterium]|nr:SDR family oxidoreductase [Chloroflexota bacterium]